MDCEIVKKLDDLTDVRFSRSDSTFVVIDVIKFSTTVAYLLKNNVDYIKPFRYSEEAYRFREEEDNVILIGEDDGKKVSGFDYNNSPTQIEGEDLEGKKIGIRTSNGTRAIKEIGFDDNIYIGGTVNAKFLASELKKLDDKIYLVASGRYGKESIEDTVGAELIRDYCINGFVDDKDLEVYKDRIRNSKSANKVRSLGSYKDIEKVLDFNSMEIVPKLRNGLIS